MIHPEMKRNIYLTSFVASTYLLIIRQEERDASILTFSSLIFGLFYSLLRSSRFLHPEKGVLSDSDEAEWRSRIIGTVHAVILVVGSLFCFYENMYHLGLEEGRGFDTTTITHLSGSSVERDTSAALFASIFGGYLQYDMCYLIWNMEENYDPTSMIHHFLYILITHYTLSGRYFTRPFAWLSFAELSTPFLHGRWFLAVQKKKDHPWYIRMSMAFAITFLFTRVVCYTFGLIDLWQAVDIWIDLPKGIYGVVFGIHVGYLLNLFWATKVVRALSKAMGTVSTTNSSSINRKERDTSGKQKKVS